VVSTLHIHRPRPKKFRPPLVQTAKVTGPYRAEHRRKKIAGKWRDAIEDAFKDAKTLGTGASVVSSERILLAKFENAMKFIGDGERSRSHKSKYEDEIEGEETETEDE
jgi:hypothetical protein